MKEGRGQLLIHKRPHTQVYAISFRLLSVLHARLQSGPAIRARLVARRKRRYGAPAIEAAPRTGRPPFLYCNYNQNLANSLKYTMVLG